MTTPSASGSRQFLAAGDSTIGNVKVVELGLLAGSSISPWLASPTPGASKSAAMYIAVASFIEDLLLLRMYLPLVEGLDAASAWIHYSTSSGLTSSPGQATVYGAVTFVNFSWKSPPVLMARLQTHSSQCPF